MSELVRKERRDHIFEIVLNRPEKRNAMNMELFQQFDQAVREVEKAVGVRCVLIRGEGKAFSAGIDITGLMTMAQQYGENFLQRMRVITADYQAVLNHLERLELPTIVLIHGFCLGLGMEMALACDLRIMTESATMGLPESLLGLIPDVGGTTRLTRLVGPGWAKEVIFTGRQFDAKECERMGLVNRVVKDDELLQAGEALAEQIAAAAPLAVGMSKRVIDGQFDVQRGLELEGWAQSLLVATEDFTEGVTSFLEKRKPEFKGK